jgi:hypothetical protein
VEIWPGRTTVVGVRRRRWMCRLCFGQAKWL